ncbi:MAG: DUF2459 domain-containing protein [Bacteroidota bacterium]
MIPKGKYHLSFKAIFLVLIMFAVQLSGQDDSEEFEILVVQEGWHTGIVFKTNDVDSTIWPEIVHYRNKNFVDVGWGDEKFYQVPGYPVFVAARAVLFPTQSVLRVFPYSTPILSAYFEDSKILTFTINRQQLDRLSRFVAESYKRDKNGNAQLSKLYENNQHYFLATRNYHLFRTCNTWIALGFKKSGFDVRSFFVLYGKQLIRQLRDIPDSGFLRE